jgi:trigger factor
VGRRRPGSGWSPRYRGPIAVELTTSTTEIGDSRVRLDVQVDPAVLERELNGAAREMARELRIPGFRQGKVPPQVVVQRMGRQAVLDEAVRRALPGWYEKAVHEAGLVTVGDPKVDLADLPGRGRPLSFTIEVAVRPRAKLGPYKGLEVPRREAHADPAAVDAEIERLRTSVAGLETVERPAELGGYAVIDFVGSLDGEPFEGGESQGFLLELGSGRLIPGFEEQLVGAQAGDERDVRVKFPDDYPAEHLRGREAVFRTTVREVKARNLPELDDDFAAEAGGFETLAELRADVEQRLREAMEQAIEGEFREAAVDAVVAQAQIDVPSELVHAKGHEMWEATARRLRAQGIDPERYAELTGKTVEELVHESEPEAEQALKRESVLDAVIRAEGIEVRDDEVLDSMRSAMTGPGQAPPSERELRRAFDRARDQGRVDLLREDIAMRRAVDLLVANAQPVPVGPEFERGSALWTPEQGGPEEGRAKTGAGRIWTPGRS